MEATEAILKIEDGFLKTNQTSELKDKLTSRIITLDVSKATVEKIVNTLEVSHRLLPKEAGGVSLEHF